MFGHGISTPTNLFIHSLSFKEASNLVLLYSNDEIDFTVGPVMRENSGVPNFTQIGAQENNELNSESNMSRFEMTQIWVGPASELG